MFHSDKQSNGRSCGVTSNSVHWLSTDTTNTSSSEVDMDAPTDVSDALTDLEPDVEVPHSSVEVSICSYQSPTNSATNRFHDHSGSAGCVYSNTSCCDNATAVRSCVVSPRLNSSDLDRLTVSVDQIDSTSHSQAMSVDTVSTPIQYGGNSKTSSDGVNFFQHEDIDSTSYRQFAHSSPPLQEAFASTNLDHTFEDTESSQLEPTSVTYGKHELIAKPSEASLQSPEFMAHSTDVCDVSVTSTVPICTPATAAIFGKYRKVNETSVEDSLLSKEYDITQEHVYNEGLLQTVQNFNQAAACAALTSPVKCGNSPALMRYTNLDKPETDCSAYEDISDGEDGAIDTQILEEKPGGAWVPVCESVLSEVPNVEPMMEMSEERLILPSDVQYQLLDSVYSNGQESASVAANDMEKQGNESLPSMSAFQAPAPTAAGDGPIYQHSSSSIEQFNNLPITCSLSTSPDSGFLTKSSFNASPPELNRAINSLATDIGGPSYAMEFYDLESASQYDHSGVQCTTEYPPADMAYSDFNNWYGESLSYPSMSPYHQMAGGYTTPIQHKYCPPMRYVPYPLMRPHHHSVSATSMMYHKYPPIPHYCHGNSSCNTWNPFGPQPQLLWYSSQGYQQGYLPSHQPSCSHDGTWPLSYSAQQSSCSYGSYAGSVEPTHHNNIYLSHPRNVIGGIPPMNDSFMKPGTVSAETAAATTTANLSSAYSEAYQPAAEDVTPVPSITDMVGPSSYENSKETAAKADEYPGADSNIKAHSLTESADLVTEPCQEIVISQEVVETDADYIYIADTLRNTACHNVALQTSFTSYTDDVGMEMRGVDLLSEGGLESEEECDCYLLSQPEQDSDTDTVE